MDITDLQALMERQEELRDELKLALHSENDFPVLKHPLVFAVPYIPQMNAFYNEQYEQKLQAVDEAFRDHNWTGFIFLHERPYRLDAFSDIEHLVTPEKYWELLGMVWSDSENIWQNLGAWIDYFSDERPGREHMMEEDEREAFAQLPDTLTIYRGYCRGSNMKSCSWTLDQKRAEWFAKRFAVVNGPDSPRVAEGVVAKSDVIAYFTERQESEIVVLPDAVDIRSVRQLPLTE
jgi:hypothetical protein